MWTENSVNSSNTHMSTPARCRPAAGALSRGGFEWRGSCFGAFAGWGPGAASPCLRPTVHPVRGRVRREGTRWTPMRGPTNLQQTTVQTQHEEVTSPYYFHGTHAPSPLPTSRQQPVPGKTRSEDNVRPFRPPSLRCPAAGSHLSRNASSVGTAKRP